MNKKCSILIRKCLVAEKPPEPARPRGDCIGRILTTPETEKVAIPRKERNLKLENKNQSCFLSLSSGPSIFSFLLPSTYIYFLWQSSVFSFSKHMAIESSTLKRPLSPQPKTELSLQVLMETRLLQQSHRGAPLGQTSVWFNQSCPWDRR